ncbi:peptidoglycan-binding protein [Rudanella lutea]|uniref:peptidoglycan-binding protein n=1 Tax=Rudanella lutea TaxID=451374 RepID=UPI0003628169|nr:peptidoglycan-binding protein [Rudanella lutea]
MIKTAFQNEISLDDALGRGSKGAAVRRLQEWLCLSALRFPAASVVVVIDGDFGPATERAVKNLQRALKTTPTGEVTPAFFEQITHPMRAAFGPVTTGNKLPNQLISTAKQHLLHRASELQTGAGQNLGPWVRAYCDGYDGSPFLWCMGFVQTVLDQVATANGRAFTSIIPQTLSCDVVAMAGSQNGRYIPNADIRKNPKLAKPGDLFLLRFTNTPDWFHTGLITEVDDDVFETIEGNTNEQSSNNGTAVFARVRNFRKATIDVYRTEGL